MLKRFFDFVFSVLGLCILLPFLLVIAWIVKIDSKGPAFYLQQRVGRGAKLFNLFKFRTMHVEADKLTAITVGKRDPRITTIGYYLRKYKMDELPQLINVVRGDMSLVGPRPELKKFVDLYSDQQREVISVRPGITDLASIEFRNENEMLEGKADPIEFYIREIMPVKLELNRQYIQNQSLFLDMKIIFTTLFSIFKKNK
ncbi:MAG TPA: sugar transferase [Chryseolinea sp.]|nr:sugar transferase [Chryseolinea sp.]HPH47791.1 sugar transferase [Chryseolinea sp.]HPM31543.1 sugar transferase [Chryseolinea sp.]